MSLLLRLFIVTLLLCINYLIRVSSIKLKTIHKKNDVNLYNYEPMFNNHQSGRRIFGGKYATNMNSIPFMVYVLRITTKELGDEVERNIESCGATILDKTHVLTAAHCVKSCSCMDTVDDADCPSCEVYSPNDLEIFAGSTVANKSTSIFHVKRVFIHPEHKYVDDKHNCLNRYDIAVLQLTKPLKYSNTIKPVTLPKAVKLGHDNINKTMTTILANSKKRNTKKCLIVGWGMTSLNDTTKALTEKIKIAKVPLISMSKCISALQLSLNILSGYKVKSACTEESVCTESNNDKIGICHGDSGGPVLCGGVQVGISSWSVKTCVGKNVPSVFTRVDVSMDWIKHVMTL